ncbi:MAG: outer membrane protein assembly factor BamB family protein, partial [Planctomycetota bacterium]
MGQVIRSLIINNTKVWGICLLCGILLAPTVRGQEWTRFRGPNGQGISHAQTIPVKWTEKNFNWKAKLPAGGHSSPVIWKDKVFLTCENPESAGGILSALDVSDGHTVWNRQYDITAYRHHPDNSYAVATPTVDADHVCVLWQTSKETILAAINHSGREIWQRNFPGIYSQFGPGTSPMLFDDIIVFTHEHWEAGKEYRSTWIALDRNTGQTRWMRERNNSQISYSTPCVYSPEIGKLQLVFTSQAHGITSVEPNTGKVIWELQSVLPARVVSS